MINEEDLKKCFNNNYINDELSNIFNKIEEETRINIERLMLLDIIDIYRGVYNNYNDYVKNVNEYNQRCENHNSLKFEKDLINVTKTFMIKRNVFTEMQFNFIRTLYENNHMEDE